MLFSSQTTSQSALATMGRRITHACKQMQRDPGEFQLVLLRQSATVSNRSHTMQEIRRAVERGYADHGWLRSYHSFSFADYYDPKHVEFGALRVINEDRVAAGQGFGTHAHRDMEIITYVLEGQLEHKDSIGTGSIIEPGDVQRMSAGTGVRHSEFNPLRSTPVHFLQIWIQPNERGIPPGYEQKRFDTAAKRGRLRLIASPDGRDGSVTIHQDAYIHAGLFNGAEHAIHSLGAGRRAYVHVARGRITVNGEALDAGDAAKLTDATEVKLENGHEAEVLLFDLS
jgi:redox-sensitive bicupin YhaK (pirin superfamily)